MALETLANGCARKKFEAICNAQGALGYMGQTAQISQIELDFRYEIMV